MVNNFKILALICIILSGCVYPVDAHDAYYVDTSSEEKCVNIGGTVDYKLQECAGISQSQCDAIGGEYDACASSCRGNPQAIKCNMMCNVICSIKN